MIQDREIAAIARQVANARLSPRAVEEVFAEAKIDSEGRNALRITIVVKPNKVASLKGDAILDTLHEIQNKLQEAGEERLPIIEYATKKELEESGNDKS